MQLKRHKIVTNMDHRRPIPFATEVNDDMPKVSKNKDVTSFIDDV